MTTAPASKPEPRSPLGEPWWLIEQTREAPLPIVVGVTAHRDLRAEDTGLLEGMVRATFLDLQERYSHCPLMLLSPLAEGGDRLVARVASQIGVRLVVPLPLPQDLYEEDFESDHSRAEFRALLAGAECSFELPLVPGNTEEGIRSPGEQRNRQYAQVGAYIARQCQVFLALWDGVDGKPGGTAEVVRYRLEGAPVPYDPPRSPLTFVSTGPVYHIVTPREQNPAPANAFTRHNLAPANRTVESFHDLYDRMDLFNQDAAQHRDLLRNNSAVSKGQLLQVEPGTVADAIQALPASSRAILEQYAVCDGLALHFGGRTATASRYVFAWVFVAALCFNLYHSLPHAHLDEHASVVERILGAPWFLILFLLTSAYCRFVIHRRAAEGDYQNKHQDYRALAEGLRVQFFWRVAGLSEAVVDHYLRKQRGALEWINNALRAWDVTSQGSVEAAHGSGADLGERLRLVQRLWVVEQRTYFASKARREQAKLEEEEHIILRLFISSVGLSLLLALVLILPLLVPVHALEAVKHWAELPWVHGVIMATIVGLAVAAGLRHGYNQQMARSEHAKQFARMSELFDNGARRLDQLLRDGEHAEAAALLKELGAEALEENGDWVLLHRERPLEVPHAG